MLTEEFLPLTPVNFFQLQVSCHYVKANKPFGLTERNEVAFRLPQLMDLCDEEEFADIALAWNEEGIELFASVHVPLQKAYYPQVSEGDSVELFIDTRDVKTSGFNTKFCHHFFFLPESYEGIAAGEITRFRTDDMHELCESSDLKVKVTRRRRGYLLQGFIPSSCLHGYEPEQFNRMGVSYRVNRLGFDSQHFSVVTDDYVLEQQPSLWSSATLMKR